MIVLLKIPQIWRKSWLLIAPAKKKIKAFFYIGTPQSHVILEMVFDPSYKNEHKAFYLDESKSSDLLGKIKEKYPLAFAHCNLIPTEYFDGTFKAVPEKYSSHFTDGELWLEQKRVESKRISGEKNAGREAAVVWSTALLVGIGVGIALAIGTAGVGFLAIIIGAAVTAVAVGLYHLIKNQIRKSREKKEKAKKTEEIPADLEPELTKPISDVVDFMLINPNRALFFMSPALKGERDFCKELLESPLLIEKMIMEGDEKLLHAITVSGLLYRPVSHLYSNREVQAYNIIAAIASIPLLERIKEFNLLGFNNMVDNRIKELQSPYVKIMQATLASETAKEKGDYSIEQYAHLYNDVRKLFSEGEYEESKKLFETLCDEINVNRIDLPQCLISLLQAVGGADRFDQMIAETIESPRLKDAVMTLMSTPNYSPRNPTELNDILKDNTSICQLFMLEKIYSARKDDNRDYIELLQNKYIEILMQCKDELLAIKFFVRSKLINSKENALKIFSLTDIVEHMIWHPEDAALLLGNNIALQKALADHPKKITRMIKFGPESLHVAIESSGMIKAIKNEKIKLYTRHLLNEAFKKAAEEKVKNIFTRPARG